MKMKDLLGFGKMLPMDKLLDMLSKTVGVVTKPFFDRRDIDTEAYKVKKLAMANAEAMRIVATAVKENTDGVGGINYSEGGMTIESFKQTREQFVQCLPTPSLEERTRTRIEHQEATKQLNIEGVTAFAVDELRNEPPVTDEPVDEGWSSRFFKYAEEISDEGMQSIWGKILAGEIKQPNTYSLRTLEVLRNLSKYEAETFVKAAGFAFKMGSSAFLFKGSNIVLDNFGLGFTELSILREVGILHEGEFTSLSIYKSDDTVQLNFHINSLVIIIERKPSQTDKAIPAYIFTQVGMQLLKLVQTPHNNDYLNAFATFLKDENTTAQYGFILGMTEDVIHHTQPLREFPLISGNPSQQL